MLGGVIVAFWYLFENKQRGMRFLWLLGLGYFSTSIALPMFPLSLLALVAFVAFPIFKRL